MTKVTLQCPSCGGQVDLGDIECRHCGLNLKSGEAYEEQIKKARGKDEHLEHFAAPVFVGAVLVFGLLLLSGWLFQRRMETAIKDRSDIFVEYVREFQSIEDLIVQQNYPTAQERTQTLITKLDKEAESTDVPDPYEREKKDLYRPSLGQKPKYNKAAVKQLLLALKAKAERMLKEIESLQA